MVKSGDTVTLSCDYDLEQVALYTIKWYWKDEEFYRFVPKESPPSKAFTTKYINVDVSLINIRLLSFAISGENWNYRNTCKMSFREVIKVM